MDDETRKRIIAAQSAPPPEPIEGTRQFLQAFCSDADSMESMRKHVAGMLALNPRSVVEGLASIDKLLADLSIDPSTLLWLVGYDAGWVLEDKSEESARSWLQGIAEMLREEIARAGHP